ncbi:hypothetical protein LTR62_008756 [Meristemomyces frigidus]|uniref:Uncharacterized protein n=1 Tax=Meristemomyces frigidus TaxID=1508187 RepID=A0AAN7T9E1_9PEZI|nr:hypothetical protein LTR62_008756 [Meristemomyces frigidus]
MSNGIDFKADHTTTLDEGSPLSRERTVTLSNEQYERLFFQPEAPRRGDAAKRFGNPSLLGLLGFLVPYTGTILTLCQFSGAVPPYTLVGLTGDYYMIGMVAMILAGLMEFILGNTFPMVVFIIYGCHWGSLGYTQDPIHLTTSVFTEALGGATGAAYESSQAFHNVAMCLVSFVLMLGTLRVNVFFALTFFGLVMLFAFLAAADFYASTITNAAGLAHLDLLLKLAGSFGFIGLVCGWYLAIIEGCAAVAIPCPLPVFDLGTKIFPAPKAKSEA